MGNQLLTKCGLDCCESQSDMVRAGNDNQIISDDVAESNSIRSNRRRA